MSLVLMQEPFSPIYNFNDIPTDEEVAASKLLEKPKFNSNGGWPFPYTKRNLPLESLEQVLSRKKVQQILEEHQAKKALIGSFDSNIHIDCSREGIVVLENKYEVSTEEWDDAISIGMSPLDILYKCEAYANGVK